MWVCSSCLFCRLLLLLVAFVCIFYNNIGPFYISAMLPINSSPTFFNSPFLPVSVDTFPSKFADGTAEHWRAIPCCLLRQQWPCDRWSWSVAEMMIGRAKLAALVLADDRRQCLRFDVWRRWMWNSALLEVTPRVWVRNYRVSGKPTVLSSGRRVVVLFCLKMVAARSS